MTKRTLEESKAFILQTFKELHQRCPSMLPTDEDIKAELGNKDMINSNPDLIVDFYFEKYLPDIFFKALELLVLLSFPNSSNADKTNYTEINRNIRLLNFILVNYFDGNISSKIWREKIWGKMTLEQQLLFLKIRNPEKGAVHYLVEANNSKMLKEYLAYYTKLLRSEGLNEQQLKVLEDIFHIMAIETITELLTHSQDTQPSECLCMLFDMLKQNAISSTPNAPLKEIQLYFLHTDQTMQMKHKIQFMDYFVYLCYDFFQKSISHTYDEEHPGPTVNPINLLIKLLKSHLTEAEFKEFDELFKGKYNQLFENQPIMEEAWKAYNLAQLPAKESVTPPIVTTNQPEESIPLQTQVEIEDLPTAINGLKLAINMLDNYGKYLQQEKKSKGEIITILAADLLNHVNALPKQPTEADFNTLRDSFEYSINQRSLAIKEYRVNLYTIFKNIAIALTGIGAIIQAGYWGYKKATTGKGLFFYQKPTTTSEDKLENVNQNLDELGKQIKNP